MTFPRVSPRLAVVALLLLAAAAFVAWRAAQGRAVEVVALSPTRLTQTVVVSGRVLPPAKVEIGATVTGRVVTVEVDDGDRVAEGQPLVRLETAELAAALAQAVAAERTAESRIRQWSSVGAPAAQEQLVQAEANERLAQAEAERQEALFRQGFVGQARLDEARRALAVARSQAAAARAAALANRSDGAERALLDDQLAQARAARLAAAARLAQATIAAPAAGVVLDRTVEPGNIAQPGRTMITLALDGPTRLAAPIDEKNLAVLAVGQRAVASADAFADRRFDATLESLSPGIDAQRGTVEAKFSVPSPPAFLRADMTVSIDVSVADKAEALVLPAAALRDLAAPEPWVLVLRDGRAQRVGVKVGTRTPARVEIVSGLDRGAAVIVDASVAPGDRVRAR